MHPAIRVENLGKKYRIGARRAEYRTIRESVSQAASRPFKRALRLLRGEADGAADLDQTLWALKGVSFEIEHGEVVGIIGRNGAGKSTLLKILSRITPPSEGRAEVEGRIGSLLEVGTGFHPELTGRENVYLNGTILGMRRAEVVRRFDEIVAFAETETFLDTPVKHYSSGMRMRLAFAIAAHLDTEILLVDEVLAVGDLAFQRKCLGKMGEVARAGRTICFVSHNTAAIHALCRSGILMERGRLLQRGPIDDIITTYEERTLKEADAGSGLPAFNETYGIGIDGCTAELRPCPSGSLALHVDLEVTSTRPGGNIGVGIAVRTVTGSLVSLIAPAITNHVIEFVDGTCSCSFLCENIDQYLAGGDYVLDVWLAKPRVERLVTVENVSVFRVPPRDVYSTGAYVEAHKHGPVPLPVSFSVRT